MKKLLDFCANSTETIIYKILLGIFNLIVFIATLFYMYFLLEDVTTLSQQYALFVNGFVLLPICSIVWLRFNSLLKNILSSTKPNISFAKLITNVLLFLFLVYEIFIFIQYTQMYQIGFYHIQLWLESRFNILAMILTIALLLFIIYIKNFDNIKFCSNCGAKVKLREKFCKKCGSKLN